MAIANHSGARWRWIILVGVLVSGPLLAQSADADIEAVQRKLDAAKKAQADREAAQRANAAAQAQMGTLVIKADRNCALSVNGASKGRLTAEQTTSVKVQAGEQLIECVADDRQRFEVTHRVPVGEQVVVRLAVRPPERFEMVADGVKDHEQQLIWANADNGSNITWDDARRYCLARGSGWLLPSASALGSLYDASGAFRREWKLTYVFANPATPLIQISSCCFWSSESNETVSLNNGTVYAARADATDSRALCVRRS